MNALLGIGFFFGAKYEQVTDFAKNNHVMPVLTMTFSGVN